MSFEAKLKNRSFNSPRAFSEYKKIILHEKQRFSCSSITEWDVWKACKKLFKYVQFIELPEKLSDLEWRINDENVDVIFNLTEEFNGDQTKDYLVSKVLEELRVPFVGGDSYSLRICKNKVKLKSLLKKINIKTPSTFNGKNFPAILKLANADASLGIAKKNIVFDIKEYSKRKKELEDRFKQKVFAESFIKGREYFTSIWRNRNGEILLNVPRELVFSKSKDPRTEIFSERYKWSYQLQKKIGIKTTKAKLSKKELSLLTETSLKIYTKLNLRGHVRLDFRMSENGTPFLIDINSNPNLARDDDFALSHEKGYLDLINELVQSALKEQSSSSFEIAS